MKKVFVQTAISLIVFSLAACSSGGGGSDDDGGSSSRSGVRVIHGALDGSPMALLVDGQGVGSASFGTAGSYQGYPPGPQTISLVRKSTSAPALLSVEGDVDRSKRQSVIVVTRGGFDEFRGKFVTDDPGEIGEGLSAVRVINGVQGSGSLNVSLGAEAVSGVELGDASAYVEVSPGPLAIQARTGSGTVVYAGNQTLEPDKSYTILIAGEVGYFVVGKRIEN